MATDDPPPRRSAPGFLRWLRAGGRDPGVAEANRDPPAPSAAGRAELVDRIGRFLAAHDLEVSTFTLRLAHDYLTDEDKRMVRLIDRQIALGAPITVGWLERLSYEAGGDDDRKAMAALMVTLQGNLDEFGRTTKAARSAASDYGFALQAQVGEIGRAEVTSAVIAEITGLARAMLVRTRELEQEMSRSDLLTKELQHNLDKARRSAERDDLTGLPNRRAFEARLASEYAAAQRDQDQLCIAFCDIDNFKAINDAHGHEAGDRVLRAVAETLGRISNDRCHVARHGGEEFVVLFRGMSVADCRQQLDEVRAQQAERRLVNRATDAPFGRVTFSAGIADIGAFPNPRSALRAADQALYRAKEEGRNRVLIAQDQPGGEMPAPAKTQTPTQGNCTGSSNTP